MTIIYGFLTVIAILLLFGYNALIKQKEMWLFLLYICVVIVNAGYFLLSCAKTVPFAILANDISYFGSVFLSLCMLMIIVKLCGIEVKKKMIAVLIIISFMMFGVVATSGFLPLYYREVSLSFVAGATKLNKVYGVLHPLYLVYLFSYFGAMIFCITQSVKLKKIASQKHAVLMVGIVFGNISVWFIEKFIPWDFEFLSVTYLFSEIVFLGLYWMMHDYVSVHSLNHGGLTEEVQNLDIATMQMEDKISKVLSHLDEGILLTSREREILELLLKDKRRKEIAEELHLSENTIKTYLRTLYSKLKISSKEELLHLLIK